MLACVAVSAAGAVTAHKNVRQGSTPPPVKAVGAAGMIALAQHQLDLGNFATAADYAAAGAEKAPTLEDYAYYIREQAEYALKSYSEAGKSATRVFDQAPTSPLIGPAAALAIRAELDGDSPKQALELIKKYHDVIPQPGADLLLARCYAATRDLAQAAQYYRNVYYAYPTAKEATDAANALVDLKQRMGDQYPAITASEMLERAQKLFDSNNPGAARIELYAAIPQLSGVERDQARVRLGVADFLNKNAKAAFEYLTALKVDESEADAERLSYVIRCARKLDRHAEVKAFLEHLEQQHPASKWRLEALIFIADQARADNDAATYLPLYRACAVTFPKDSHAAWCHWRVAFESYRTESADAYDLLRSHVEEYPDSTDVNDALYFLGRLSERKNDLASARACYEQLIAHFPNTYFAVEARERLVQPALQAATASEEMLTFLKGVAWRPREQFPSFDPSEAVKARIERAQLLELTGLTDFAEGELKFGARNDGIQPNVYAFELAKMAAARGSSDEAMRSIKTYAPDYLYMPLDEAPVAFWRLAFPFPYRDCIEQYSREQSLDPFVVAALIRQESEFNPKVISHAHAYGLMQLLPSTGRELARHFGVRRLPAAQLLTADRNIQLGTYYFRNSLNNYGGQPELALASYNAGPGRANLWRTWGPFREPAEFIETVPFHETRGYIQIVLRNADVYRRLYAGTVPDVPAYRPKPAPKAKPKRPRKRASTQQSAVP